MVDIVNSTRTSKSMPPPVSDILGMRMARRKVLEIQGTEGKGFPPQNGHHTGLPNNVYRSGG